MKAYVDEIGSLPNIAFPSSYNEKMFWRRVFDRDPAFVTYCDKLATKKIFENYAGDLHVAETLWTGTDPDALPAELCNDDVVVKFNAASTRNWFFGRPPEPPDRFKSTLRRWMRRWPYGAGSGQWGYSQVKPLLYAERMVAPAEEWIVEFSVHLFGGEVFYTLVYLGEKRRGSLCSIYDESGNRLSVTNTLVMRDPARALPEDFELPDCYATAMRIARDIARDSDYLRIDFMCPDGKLYGGEVTVYPGGGLMTNSDPEVLAEMGRIWDLRRSWFLRTPQSGWRQWYRAKLQAFAETNAKERGSE